MLSQASHPSALGKRAALSAAPFVSLHGHDAHLPLKLFY